MKGKRVPGVAARLVGRKWRRGPDREREEERGERLRVRGRIVWTEKCQTVAFGWGGVGTGDAREDCAG